MTISFEAIELPSPAETGASLSSDDLLDLATQLTEIAEALQATMDSLNTIASTLIDSSLAATIEEFSANVKADEPSMFDRGSIQELIEAVDEATQQALASNFPKGEQYE
jgi:hypothetical protein